MSDQLQEAIDRLVPKYGEIWATQADAEIIVEAARKVANPDYEGWICFDSQGYPQRPNFHPYAGPDDDPHYEKCGRGIVIALGIDSEDTE